MSNRCPHGNKHPNEANDMRWCAGLCNMPAYENSDTCGRGECRDEAERKRRITEMTTPEHGRLDGRRQEVIEQLCKIMSRVWSTIDPNAHNPCDCICTDTGLPYQNDGEVLTFIEEAISAAIAKRNQT